MQLTTSLLSKLAQDFPIITLEEGADFHWDPEMRCVTYRRDESNGMELLLHELAHAELGHDSYAKDIILLQMERSAWHYASAILAPRYNVIIADSIVEDNLDTYRDWLHQRSTCPKCDRNGLQLNDTYFCPLCLQRWQPNAAISTQLRRYKKHPA